MSFLRKWALGLLAAGALWSAAASPAVAAMKLGGNFWFSYRADSAIDPFVSNATFAVGSNPWKQQVIDDCKLYQGPLRFMDWGCTNNQTVVNWSDRKSQTATDQEGVWNGNKEYGWNNGWYKVTNPPQAARGIAYEWMIDLCNRTSRDMWVCVPHKANDTYVRELAKLVKSKLNTGLKVYVEYSNEVWNSMFDQQHWCEDEGVRLGLGTGYGASMAYYGRRTAQVHKMWTEEWSGSTNRLVRVVSGQAVSDTYWAGEIWNSYANNSGAADAWAIAPYFDAKGSGSASNAFTQAATSINEKKAIADTHKTFANGKSVQLVAYEGGQHVTQDAITFNRDSRIYNSYLDYLDKMNSAGFSVFVHYAHVGTAKTDGCWGAKESWTEADSTAHKWRAMKKWMTDNGGTTPPPPPPSTPPPPPPSGGSGTWLRGQYFNNTGMTGTAALTRTDATVNFAWSASPGTGVNGDGFSVRWEGQVEAPVAGTYTFYTRADDGVRLWVNGTQVVNNWVNQAPTDRTGSPTLSLAAGTKYTIKMEFYDNTGGAEARLYWSYPNQAKAIIPQGRLYPASGTTPPPPPPSGGTTTTLNPTADMSSQGDTSGTGATPPVSQWANYYAKFGVSGITGTISSAKLRVYRTDTGQGSISFRAYQAGDSWSEGGTLPALGTQIVSVTNAAVGYVEFDVTSYVQAQASGDDVASFGVDTSSGAWTTINARESASNKPQLVVVSN